jgi:hypothetical protein
MKRFASRIASTTEQKTKKGRGLFDRVSFTKVIVAKLWCPAGRTEAVLLG